MVIMPMNDTDRPGQNQNHPQHPKAKTTFVSRAGAKLAEAVEKFNPSIDGALCADLGCNVGGFTQCLLRHSATRVYAIDTGYGVLDWQLRKNPQVVVMERTNALYLKALPELCDLVTIDVA